MRHQEDPDALCRDLNDILRRAATATFTSPPEIAGAQRVVEREAATTAHSVPTLKQVLWWAERGKPPESPVLDTATVLREKIAAGAKRCLDISTEIAQQPRRRAELEAERARTAEEVRGFEAQLAALQSAR